MTSKAVTLLLAVVVLVILSIEDVASFTVARIPVAVQRAGNAPQQRRFSAMKVLRSWPFDEDSISDEDDDTDEDDDERAVAKKDDSEGDDDEDRLKVAKKDDSEGDDDEDRLKLKNKIEAAIRRISAKRDKDESDDDDDDDDDNDDTDDDDDSDERLTVAKKDDSEGDDDEDRLKVAKKDDSEGDDDEDRLKVAKKDDSDNEDRLKVTKKNDDDDSDDDDDEDKDDGDDDEDRLKRGFVNFLFPVNKMKRNLDWLLGAQSSSNPYGSDDEIALRRRAAAQVINGLMQKRRLVPKPANRR